MAKHYNRILVTGSGGFIGSHLCEYLLAEGYAVKALTQYNSFNNWGWLEAVESNEHLEIVSGDIRDPHFCRSLTEGMDVVMNLAALIAIPYSYQAPEQYLQTNAIGTLNLCQAAKESQCGRFIQMSTSEVYGTAQYVPIDEKHPLQAQSPYSASKIASDAVAYSYYGSFDLPVVIARAFNTYGPRQSARAVIPTIITQILNGATEIKLGSISPTRDFNFVEDTCMGLIALMRADATEGEVVNIGSGSEISIGDLAGLIASIVGTEIYITSEETRLRPEKSEVERLVCDHTKLMQLTDHTIKHSLEAGLRKTVQWFREADNLKSYKAHQYNV